MESGSANTGRGGQVSSPALGRDRRHSAPDSAPSVLAAPVTECPQCFCKGDLVFPLRERSNSYSSGYVTCWSCAPEQGSYPRAWAPRGGDGGGREVGAGNEGGLGRDGGHPSPSKVRSVHQGRHAQNQSGETGGSVGQSRRELGGGPLHASPGWGTHGHLLDFATSVPSHAITWCFL